MGKQYGKECRMCHTCCVSRIEQVLDVCLEAERKLENPSGFYLLQRTFNDRQWQTALQELASKEPPQDIQTAICEVWQTRGGDIRQVLSATFLADITATVAAVEAAGRVTCSLPPHSHFLAHLPKKIRS